MKVEWEKNVHVCLVKGGEESGPNFEQMKDMMWKMQWHNKSCCETFGAVVLTDTSLGPSSVESKSRKPTEQAALPGQGRWVPPADSVHVAQELLSQKALPPQHFQGPQRRTKCILQAVGTWGKNPRKLDWLLVWSSASASSSTVNYQGGRRWEPRLAGGPLCWGSCWWCR